MLSPNRLLLLVALVLLTYIALHLPAQPSAAEAASPPPSVTPLTAPPLVVVVPSAQTGSGPMLLTYKASWPVAMCRGSAPADADALVHLFGGNVANWGHAKPDVYGGNVWAYNGNSGPDTLHFAVPTWCSVTEPSGPIAPGSLVEDIQSMTVHWLG